MDLPPRGALYFDGENYFPIKIAAPEERLAKDVAYAHLIFRTVSPESAYQHWAWVYYSTELVGNPDKLNFLKWRAEGGDMEG